MLVEGGPVQCAAAPPGVWFRAGHDPAASQTRIFVPVQWGGTHRDHARVGTGERCDGEREGSFRGTAPFATGACFRSFFAVRPPAIYLSTEQLISAMISGLRARLPRKGPIALAWLMRRSGWLL